MSELSQESLKEQNTGEYRTPFQTTVIYDPNNTFATAVAFLSNRAQLVPVDPNAPNDLLAANCEYITPEVLVLTLLSDEILSTFIERGFQFMHVLEIESKVAEINTTLGADKLVRFQLDDLFDHLILVPGLCASHLLEYIICATYPIYKSTFLQSAATKGKQLLAAIEFSGEHIGKVLLQLCSSPRGFDDLATMITQGEMLNTVREKDAVHAIKHGVFFKTNDLSQCFAINCLQTDIKYVPDYVDYVLQYTFESHVVDESNYMGWRVIISSQHQTEPKSAITFLSQYSDCATGNDQIATSWIPTGQSAELMPFLGVGRL